MLAVRKRLEEVASPVIKLAGHMASGLGKAWQAVTRIATAAWKG